MDLKQSDLTPLHEALTIVLSAAQPLGLEKVAILNGLGRVLGEDIIATRDNPPWDNSAMDGFAVRWDDLKQEHAIGKPIVLKGDRGGAGRESRH